MSNVLDAVNKAYFDFLMQGIDTDAVNKAYVDAIAGADSDGAVQVTIPVPPITSIPMEFEIVRGPALSRECTCQSLLNGHAFECPYLRRNAP